MDQSDSALSDMDDTIMIKEAESWRNQCFFFSRNIGQLTPKIIYFYYLKKYFLAQSNQYIFYLILKKEALISTFRVGVEFMNVEHDFYSLWEVYLST